MIRLPGLRAPLNRGHVRAGVDLLLGRGKPRPASGDFVDRLAILDGVIVATGWTTGLDPVLTVDGEPVPDQLCVRHRRADISATGDLGYRIAAALAEKTIDNAKVAIRFDNGNQLRREPKDGQVVLALQNQFKALLAERPAPKLIEIGSRARSGVTYRHMFPADCRYFGVDIAPGPNVDFVTDAHTMAGVEDKFDFAFSVSVFEHLMMPWVAAQALNGVLNVGGVAYIQSHPSWPLHEEPWDFFRFSKDSWKSIFNAFTGFEIIGAGYAMEAAIVPANMDSGPLQGFDDHPTYLLSACLARKVGEPTVDWLVDPAKVYDLNYSH